MIWEEPGGGVDLGQEGKSRADMLRNLTGT